jgi:hypothetical protein
VSRWPGRPMTRFLGPPPPRTCPRTRWRRRCGCASRPRRWCSPSSSVGSGCCSRPRHLRAARRQGARVGRRGLPGTRRGAAILAAADTGPVDPASPPGTRRHHQRRSPARRIARTLRRAAARPSAVRAGTPRARHQPRGRVASVPLDLREAVAESLRQSWTYTEIQFLDGRSQPGLAVGAPLTVPTRRPYELYYLFPLTSRRPPRSTWCARRSCSPASCSSSPRLRSPGS